MKILIIAPHPFYKTRGTPIAVKLLAENLSKLGHQVTIFTFHEGEPIKNDAIPIRRIRKPLGVSNVPPGPSIKKLICDAILLPSLIIHLRNQRYDIVHAVEEGGFMAWVLKIFYGIPYVYDMDSYMSEQIFDKYPLFRALSTPVQWFENQMIKNSVGALAVCQSLAEKVIAAQNKLRVDLLQDVSLFELIPGKPIELPKPETPQTKTLMYVGNLEYYQGIDLLLESYSKIAKQRPGAPSRLIIVGGDDKSVSLYKQKASDLGISEHTYFLGPKSVEFLESLLTQADILVSPRIQGENTPMKIYSYLDAGNAILATRMRTHTQVLNDENACLVEANTDAMTEGITRLLRDTDYRDELGKSAKETLETHYSLDCYQDKLKEFYKYVEAQLRSD